MCKAQSAFTFNRPAAMLASVGLMMHGHHRGCRRTSVELRPRALALEPLCSRLIRREATSLIRRWAGIKVSVSGTSLARNQQRLDTLLERVDALCIQCDTRPASCAEPLSQHYWKDRHRSQTLWVLPDAETQFCTALFSASQLIIRKRSICHAM